MPRSPIVDFRTMERVLRKIGFEAVWSAEACFSLRRRAQTSRHHHQTSAPKFEAGGQKGSHVFYRHPDGRTTTVPRHPGRDLSRALTREILREAGLTPEEFSRLLEEG